MIGDMIVADATVHGYNWARDNWAILEAAASTAGGFGPHQMLTGDERILLDEVEFTRTAPGRRAGGGPRSAGEDDERGSRAGRPRQAGLQAPVGVSGGQPVAAGTGLVR